MKLRESQITHELRIQLLALAAGAPAVIACLVIMYVEQYSAKVQWTVGVVVVGAWLAFTANVGERVASPLRTLANLLEAMREGDYSIRARGARPDDALGEVMQQVNAMGVTLRAQRLGALEATTLLRKVIEEIDVAIFAFDSESKLRLINPAGERLIGQAAERVIGLPASDLELAELLHGEASQTVQRVFAGSAGRWGVARSMFREGGLPHTLLVITDLTRLLREEELQAWQRLVRVLGHELNNSLTPITSIAESLVRILKRDPRAEDWEEDVLHGLGIISARSESLSRFISSYARLAKLPKPRLQPVAVESLIGRVVMLESRLRPIIENGPDVRINADADQLEQVLINLIRNAVDASLETGGKVVVDWSRNSAGVQFRVRDEGHGLSNTANLFVPFFTTKPGGSGIGLVLSRQIVEAHGGTLALRNRTDAPGCEATITLPS